MPSFPPPLAEIPLLAFPSFSRLPPELQNKIYKLLALEPRTIKIHRKFGLVQPTPLNPNSPPRAIVYLACYDPVPIVLQICHASRTEAKNLYSPSFPAESLGRFVWVNFDTDTIKITDDALLYRTKPQDRARIRDIIVESKEMFEEVVDYRKAFLQMKDLRRLDIVTEEKLSSSTWIQVFTELWEDFDKWFGGTKGWVHPEVRLIERATGLVIDHANYEDMKDYFHRQWWEEVEGRMRVEAARGEFTGGRGTGRPYPGRIRRGG